MSIAKILAQKGKWKVNLEESLKFITHLLENKYPKNSVEYLSQKEIWKKSLDYQLGKNTWFLFENNTFWEFYNENDWLKKLFFVVDEQGKSIQLHKTENASDDYILKFSAIYFLIYTF